MRIRHPNVKSGKGVLQRGSRLDPPSSSSPFHRCGLSSRSLRWAGRGHVAAGWRPLARESAGGWGMAAARVRGRSKSGELGESGRPALYFCGSIRGGREDRTLYERIVSRLRRFGTVLTEHVAAAELGARGEALGTRAAGTRAEAWLGWRGPGLIPRQLRSRRQEPALLPRCSIQRPSPRRKLAGARTAWVPASLRV